MEAGLHILQQHRPEIKALRDATMADLTLWGAEMSEKSLRRCRHVVTENARVLSAVEAFKANDLTRFCLLYTSTSSPGTMRNRSGMLSAPERRISSREMTKTAAAA